MAETYDEEPEEEEEERKSRVGLAILVTVIAVLVLGGGAYALYQLLTPNQQTVQQVEVPVVLTYTQKQATDQLTARGLKVQVKSVNGKDDDTKGTIVDQDPKGGVMVPVASAVTITLNAGPKMAKVPGGLVGRDIVDVKRELENAGFTNVDTKAAKQEDPNAQPDEVISVSPKSGATAALDTKITVTYATGKSPVPDFFGLVESRAVDLARQSGFGTPEIVNEISPTSTAGTVIRQTPAKGKMVDRTTKIRLVIAQAAPPPTSPPPSTPPVTPPSGSPSPSTSPS